MGNIKNKPKKPIWSYYILSLAVVGKWDCVSTMAFSGVLNQKNTFFKKWKGNTSQFFR